MSKELFLKNGYCVVESAISPELRDFVTQYALFDEMQMPFDSDVQTPTAYKKYADPAMETMLLHIQPLMEKNTGLKLIPTYSYYRVYHDGDDLAPHVDRPPCEISASICFNYNYDNPDYQWPIYMDGTAVTLEPGDLVIYKGCDLSHWRNTLERVGDNVWHVQGFFHYVDANGPHKDVAFDGRPSIGYYNRAATFDTRIKKPYLEYLK